MKYLLDTNICIALLKGKDKTLITKVSQCDPFDFALCTIVKAELIYGARKSQKVAENLRVAKNFFAQFESLPFDDEASEHYGSDRALLAKAGTPIGGNDLLIAAIAKANDLILITRNVEEFARVPELAFEKW